MSNDAQEAGHRSCLREVRVSGHGPLPYESIEEMVDESAALLQGERDDEDEYGARFWVLPSEIAYHTGLDEHVVMEAMIRLGERGSREGSDPTA